MLACGDIITDFNCVSSTLASVSLGVVVMAGFSVSDYAASESFMIGSNFDDIEESFMIKKVGLSGNDILGSYC